MKQSQKGVIDSVFIMVLVLVLLVGGFVLYKVLKKDSVNVKSYENTATTEPNKDKSAINYEIELPENYKDTSNGNPKYFFDETIDRSDNPYSFTITKIDDESNFLIDKSAVLENLGVDYKQGPALFFEEVYEQLIPGLVQNRGLTDVSFDIVERDIEGTAFDHALLIDAVWVNNIGQKQTVKHQVVIDDNLNLLLIEVFIDPTASSESIDDIGTLFKSVRFKN